MGQATSLPDLRSLLVSLGLVMVIVAIDWMLPAGIVVGVLLAVPILISSASQRPGDVWYVLAISIIGFVVSAIVGSNPTLPAAVWVPNRIIALLILPAAGILANTLQQRRLEAEQSRDTALAVGETNRLLFSLLAHDLRSPLLLSRQVFDYVQQCIDTGATADPALLRDVRVRIERNLRVIDGVLASARAEIDDERAHREPLRAAGDSLSGEIEQEVASFEEEAAMRNKNIDTVLEGTAVPVAEVDSLVLRQVLAILLDNAIRYADAGAIRIVARLTGERMLLLRVEDPGVRSRPGPEQPPHVASGGAGLGIQLCRLLLSRAGGGLRVLTVPDGPTAVEAWLPLAAVAA